MIETLAYMAFASLSLRISIPYVLAAVGGTFSELGGVVNIALEGIILNGALCAVLGAHFSGNAWIGLACAIAGGMMTAWIHGVVSIRYKANQIISGLAINLFAAGATKFVLKIVFHSSSNSSRVEGLPLIKLPLVGGVHPILIIAILLVAVSGPVVYRTVFGLRLRAVGEHPAAAESLGINVARVRYSGVLISGALAGLAGAWLAFDQHQFTDGMSGGRGYIALAAMIFGKWNPYGAAAAGLFFGVAESVQIQLQTAGIQIPTQFIQMIPYLVTIIVLAGIIGRAMPPAADGAPYFSRIKRKKSTHRNVN
jgi:simple sugar transport system permease protein